MKSVKEGHIFHPIYQHIEQQCVVIKLMLQSSRLEYNMKTIGIEQ